MTHKVQIDDLIRDASSEEIAEMKAAATAAATAEQIAADKVAAVASARTKLAALGLTDDEIAALVG